MLRKQSEIVCASSLREIVLRGAQMARDNKTVKNYLNKYANNQNFCISNQLVFQVGTAKDNSRQDEKADIFPASIKKDQRCTNSVNATPLKGQNEARVLEKSKSRKDSGWVQSPLFSRRSSVDTNSKQGPKNKYLGNSENKYIDLSSIIESESPEKKHNKKITLAMKDQEKNIEKLRQFYLYNERIEQSERKKQALHQQKRKQVFDQMKSKLYKHLRKTNSTFTYDSQGNQILVDPDNQEYSLKKKYPPSNLKFQFDTPRQHTQEKPPDLNIKEKAARGEAFASAVLKTMNMSKFSLNMTSKTCNIDDADFMRRNDLFNNNHSRQITTIPFLQVSQGTNYKQANTNLTVSKKKTDRTSHSENKSKFKNFQMSFLKENSDVDKVFEQDLMKQQQKKRVQSSRPYARPKTSQPKYNLPKTARTSDRIIAINQQLTFQLIEG